jgi:hypothetical protein
MGFGRRQSMSRRSSSLYPGLNYGDITIVLLFYLVQQHCENLRQAAGYKKRVWQYLSSALPHYEPEDGEWDADPDAPEWGNFRLRCDNVISMLRYLTAKVDLDTINYADVDDIFNRTSLESPNHPRARIPNYRVPKKYRFSWVIPQRHLPNIYEFEDLVPRLEVEVPNKGHNAKAVKEGIVKTFSERVSTLSIIRIFFFVLHAHFVLFLACLLLNTNADGPTWMWCMTSTEVLMVLIKLTTQSILLQGHRHIPPVLDLIELALALGFGGALIYDYARDSSRRHRATYLFDLWWLNMIFLLSILLSNIIRETVRLIWKFQLGYWTKIYWTRGFLIIVLGIIDFLVGYFILLPAISTVNFRLCDCNNTASGCTITDPNLLCYLATFMFYFTIFLSYTMVTSIMWTLISLLWSFCQGLIRSVGAIRKWTQVQHAMDTLLLQQDLYSPFRQYFEGSLKDQVHISTNPRFVNLVTMALQHYCHLWQRDLISMSHLQAFLNWNFNQKPASQEAEILTMTKLNCHKGLFQFVYGGVNELLHKSIFNWTDRRNIGCAMQSVFSMRSVSFSIPVYAETVIYSRDQLKADDTLLHFTDLYQAEWSFFCERAMLKAPQDAIVKAYFAADRSLARLWVKQWLVGMKRLKARNDAWPPAAKSTVWTDHVLDYPIYLGYFFFHQDPPPELPLGWVVKGGPADDDVISKEDSELLDKLQYWCEQQVRWWATMRGQTLGRSMYGLMEMREALVDMVYQELKAFYSKDFVDVDYYPPTERARYDDVLAWIQRNRTLLFSSRALGMEVGNMEELKYLCGETCLQHALPKVESLSILVCSELALCCFIEEYQFHKGKMNAYNVLVQRDEETGRYLLPGLVMGRLAEAMDSLNTLIGTRHVHWVMSGLSRFEVALGNLESHNALRLKADQITEDKFQLLIGAQMYEQKKATYPEINESLALWKLRHVQFMTAKDDKLEPASYWVRRRDPFTSHHIHAYNFGKKGVGITFDSGRLSEFVTKTEIARTWPRLKLGEGKAENQNNMINALFGEVVNLMDMNQDAYYSEGLKLSLILPMFLGDRAIRIESSDKTASRRLLSFIPDEESTRGFMASRFQRRDNTLMNHLGGDELSILGFREHIFTHQHSVVGRYMALAEHSFGTIVQRFLSKPHYIRMHYGHPDMVNGHFVKKTSGVSRGSLRVNVNEDIFLGYEMAATGLTIGYTEFLFYGKGRDAEFNAASVFLKKLAQGCAMQLASRQVTDLYLTHLTIMQKIALFYGTLNHFVNIVAADTSIFVFAYMFTAFQVAQITTENLWLVGSAAGAPWILQLGFLNALPMLVERRIEQTYLGLTDVLLSLPFFAHQNRITSAYFRIAITSQRAGYLASGRGLGNTNTSLLEIYLYHASSNFIAGSKLILLVIYFTALGGDVLFLLWSLIAGVSYIAAPIMYNPKPSPKAMVEGFKQFTRWLKARDEIFDRKGYDLMKNSEQMLTTEEKKQIFGVDENIADVDERLKFVAEWERRMKGGGQKQSCYGYWVWIWQDWLTACDGTHNDILPHSAFVEVVWAPLRANRLEDENGAWTSDVLYEEVELVWKDRKYERDYGFLKTFLEFYISMGIIKVTQRDGVKTIERNKLGPDASLLAQGYHLRYTNPLGELLKKMVLRTVSYGAWLILAPYIMLRKQQYPPYDYAWEFSSIALFAALFFLTYEILKGFAKPSYLSNFALKGLGTLVFVILVIPVCFNFSNLTQTLFYLLNFAIAIAWITEMIIALENYHIRRSVKTYAYRNFARLGFLMMLGHRSGIVTLYRMLFFIVAVALSVLNGILIVVGYAHTSWMFTSAAAERYMYNRK